MNLTKQAKGLLLGWFAAGLLALPGCKKAEPPPPPGAMQMMGINVDLPRLEQEFQNASPELQTVVQEIKRECRTWQLAKAGVALETLSGPFHKYADVGGEGFFVQTRRARGAYPQRYVTSAQRSLREKEPPNTLAYL